MVYSFQMILSLWCSVCVPNRVSELSNGCFLSVRVFNAWFLPLSESPPMTRPQICHNLPGASLHRIFTEFCERNWSDRMTANVAHFLQCVRPNDQMTFKQVTDLTEDDVIEGLIGEEYPISWLCIPATVVRLGKRQDKPNKCQEKVEFSCFRACENLESVLFEPNSLLRVFEPGAFAESSIRTIFVPPSVLVIGASCFQDCSLLESVVFAKHSRLMRIEEAAFSGCALRSLTIPATVEFIGSRCFLYVEQIGNQSSLEMVTFTANSILMHLGRSAFFNTSIRHLEVPRDVSVIPQYCFAYSLLETISFEAPSRMRRFGIGAFAHSALRVIDVPERLEIVCKGCFEGCESLAIVTFHGSNVREIGDRAFFGSPVKFMDIPESVMRIGDYCFGCADAHYMRTVFPLETVVFAKDSKLVHLGNGAFRNTRIQRIELPDHLETIGDACFENCVALADVIINETSTLKSIGERAFTRCSIQKVFIPMTCEVLGASAFDKCTLLEIVEQSPDSRLRFIRQRAFSQTSIQQFVVGSHVESIGDSCFERCLTLENVIFLEPSSLVSIGSRAFYQSGLCAISIPSNVQDLGSSCFGDGDSGNGPFLDISFRPGSHLNNIGKKVFDFARIRSMAIPASVKSIDKCAFFATEVGELAIDAENEDYSTVSGFLFNKEQTTLFTCMSMSIAEVVIPKSVEVIAKGAFMDAKFLVSVSFEQGSLTRIIEEEAFYACSIEQIQFEQNVASIGEKCFARCKKLHTVLFVSGCRLSEIAQLAFSQSSLGSVCVPAATTTIGTACFEGCGNLSCVSFENMSCLVTIGSMAFASTGLVEFTVPGRVERLEKSCFGRCHALKRIDFADGSCLSYIGELAFYNSGIMSIVIPRGVREIGKSCFESCVNLTHVTFEEGIELKTFAEMLFYAVPVSRVDIPESVESICRSCFARATKSDVRVELYIPRTSRLKRIEAWALQACHIQKLWIPASLEYIAPTALTSCLVDEIEVDPGNPTFVCGAKGLTKQNGEIICQSNC